VKCREVLQCSIGIWFFLLYRYLYVFYTFVFLRILCILLFPSVSYVILLSCLCIIVMYALLCIFCFHSGYPDWGFSVLFLQLQGKCHGIPRKGGAWSALFVISKLYCSMYCFKLCCSMYCFCRMYFYMYCLFVNVNCTTATGCLPKCS